MFIGLSTEALAEVDVHPLATFHVVVKNMKFAKRTQIEKSESLADQLEAQTLRAVLAQKRTQMSMDVKPRGLFKAFQRDSKRFKAFQRPVEKIYFFPPTWCLVSVKEPWWLNPDSGYFDPFRVIPAYSGLLKPPALAFLPSCIWKRLQSLLAKIKPVGRVS